MCNVVYIFLTFAQSDLGSPLTKIIDTSGNNCIIGVTIREHMGTIGTILHFVRINYVLDAIRSLVQELQQQAAAENCNTDQQDMENKPSKRHKSSLKEEE